MKALRSVALLVASALVFAAIAIEPPKSPPGAPAKPAPDTESAPTEAPAPADEPAATDEPAASDEPASDEEELPPLPPAAAPVGPSPQRFNPTEKVRADFPVSFPIDI